MEYAGARAAVRPWRDRGLIALAAGVVLIATFHLSGVGGLAAQTVVVWLGLAVLHSVLILYAWQVTRHADLPRLMRRFWLGMVGMGAAFLVGDLGHLVILATSTRPQIEDATGSSFQSSAVDVGTVIVIAALVTSPLGFTTIRQRVRFWLDTATVMVSAAAFGWYFSLVPGSHLYDGRTGGAVVAVHDVLFGPVAMLLGMFVTVKVMLSDGRPFTRLSGTLLASAAGVQGVVAGAGTGLVADGRLGLVFALNIVANGMLAASAVIQRRQLAIDPSLLLSKPRRQFSFLPYGAIAATYALLVVVLQDGLNLRAWLVLGSAIVSTVLVVVRQLAAFAENSRLLGELDAKIRERDELAAALHHLAFHDSLTGLANRALFTDRLDADLARGRRAGTSTAVMLIDLDNFKPVNDRLGHRAGDDLLKEVARRLLACVRETDTIARLGGDEFAVLLEHPLDDGLSAVAARIVSAVGEPVVVGGEPVSVGASVGVAVGRAGDGSADSLLNDADLAMYRAKRRGKGAYEITTAPPRDRRHLTPPIGLARLGGPVSPGPHGDHPLRRRSDRVSTA